MCALLEWRYPSSLPKVVFLPQPVLKTVIISCFLLSTENPMTTETIEVYHDCSRRSSPVKVIRRYRQLFDRRLLRHYHYVGESKYDGGKLKGTTDFLPSTSQTTKPGPIIVGQFHRTGNAWHVNLKLFFNLMHTD
jgi:hypothetical protein